MCREDWFSQARSHLVLQPHTMHTYHTSLNYRVKTSWNLEGLHINTSISTRILICRGYVSLHFHASLTF